MQANEALEQKLWSITRPNPVDRESFVEIIEYLFNRLSEHLRQPLEVIGKDAVNADSFCRSFRGSVAPLEPFRITFVGTIGMDLVGDEFKPHYNASLFLFGDHQRLSAGQPSKSFIELSYKRDKNDFGNWRSLGWLTDDYQEFEDIEEDDFR